jgi:hypothetical protein
MQQNGMVAPMPLRRLAIYAALAVAVLLAACGDDSSNSTSGDDLPPGVVATVGDREITGADLRAAKARVRRSLSGDGQQAGSGQLEQQAIASLLEEAALEQEARKLGIEVRRAEVAKRWRDVARRQFASERARKRFLGRQTVDDVVRSLRVQELKQRIRNEGGDDALTELEDRVRETTACRSRYDVPACGGD